MSAKPAEETRPPVSSEDVVARIGETIRNHLAQATEAERHRCVEQLAEWGSERERDRREEHLSRVARGIPAPYTYTPLYAGTPPRAVSTHDTAEADTIATAHSDRADQGYETPPRTTKANAPLPPKRRRKAKGRVQEQGEHNEATSTEVAESELGLLDRMD